MRIVSITWVHNEEDILETFVRHHAAILDEMIIVPHECTDATEQILERLQAEGLPVTIRHEHRPYYERPAAITELLHQLSADASVTWVLPLDTDELLCATLGSNPRDELECANTNVLYALPWKTYVPTMHDDTSQTDIRKRMQARRRTEPSNCSKILVSSALANETHCSFAKGNHMVMSGGLPIKATTHPTLYLAHFPVRSETQIRNKVRRICDCRSKDPTYQTGQSFHLFALQERCNDPTPFSAEELTSIALRYATRSETVSLDVVIDPVQIPPPRKQIVLPTVEIHGPFFKNSGDHLMAYAIAKTLEGKAITCMKSDRRNLWSPRVKVTAQYLRSYPEPMAGEPIQDDSITAVIDASGYAYSSVWDEDHIVRMAEQYRHWKAAGRSIVMFPQSFGPFYSGKAIDAMREMVALADQVFAREEQSYRYLKSICHTAENIHIAADFTASVYGEITESMPTPHTIGIVPNKRMIDKTKGSQSEHYMNFLSRCITLLRSMNLQPVLVQHEQDDHSLIQELVEKHDVLTYTNLDPVVLKGFLGKCRGVISSRYHGCIAGLSQGVPVLATSWSHKYEDLFAYYGCREHILSVDMHDFQLERAFAAFTSDDLHRKYAQHISLAADNHRQDTDALWATVLPTLLTSKKHCSSPSMQYNQVV